MTNKEKDFVKQYIIDFNATQAAIRAKYSIKTAREIGYQNLTKLHIQDAISKELEKRKERLNINQDRVVHELMSIAFSDVKNYLTDDGSIDFEQLKDHNSNVIQSYEEVTTTTEGKEYSNTKTVKRFKLHDKMKALELLGKHLAMYIDKKELTGKGGKDFMIVTPELKAMMEGE